jgi:glycosyltransferase involved in cell wall biosynthesis
VGASLTSALRSPALVAGGWRVRARVSSSISDAERHLQEHHAESSVATLRSLHLITSNARRGAETFAVDLAAALLERGHEAEVAALSPSGGDELHEVPVLGPSRRSLATYRGLRRLAARTDVVVAHGASTLEACALGLTRTGVPFVYRTIGDPSYWVTTRTRREAVGILQRRAARHVALWERAAEQLARSYRLPRTGVDVIPNAVPRKRFERATPERRRQAREGLQVEEGRPCLLFVGALSPEKDVTTLLEAMRSLGDMLLLVAGDGPQRDELRAAASGQPNIRFLGPVRDPYNLYAAADLLLLPSRTEGMPAVVIEAGLVGTASVCTPVGAIPEMVVHGRSGFLFHTGDPVALAEAVFTAIPEAEEVGSRAAEAFATRYSIEAVSDQWAATLDATASDSVNR